MDNMIATGLYGWLTSFLRRRVQPYTPETKNAINTAIHTSTQLLLQDENSDKSLPASTESGPVTPAISDLVQVSEMDKETKPTDSNDDQSIEEDIEEVITEGISDADASDDKIKTAGAFVKKRQLFDLEPGGPSSNFTIDDEPLSGGGLAKHFKSDNKSEPLKQSEHSCKDETFSQRTENDVSEIDEGSQLYTKSLDFKSSVLNVDPRDCLSLESPVRIIQPRPDTNDSDESYERDHSIEEVMASNHSIEITLNEGELSSLDPNIDIDNQSQINKILGDSQSSQQSREAAGSVKQSELSRDVTDVCLKAEQLSESEDLHKSANQSQNEIDLDIQTLTRADDHSLAEDSLRKEEPSKIGQSSTSPKDMESRSNREDETYSKDVDTIRTEEYSKLLESSQDEKVSKTETLSPTNFSQKNEKHLTSANHSESEQTLHSIETKTNTPDKSESDESDMIDLRKRILSHPSNSSSTKSSGPILMRDSSFEQTEDQSIVVKRMERVEGDYTKEALDDITEESEKVSQQCGDNDNTSNDFDSIISLNMIQMLENKVKDLQEIVTSKDVCLASLSMQLDSAHRRELFAASAENRDSLRDLPPSGRESSSLATTTTSTEYRTIHEDIVPKVFDFHTELVQRDHLIEKLTDSLQQSVQVREELQTQSDKLATEVQQLRKQLAETLDQIKKPYWPRDQESCTTGQRLSEISIDLVSESDEDLERHFLTDNEEKMSISNRNSKERQLSADNNSGNAMTASFENFEPFCVSKQIEQFQKYLNPDEVRIFFMIQKKYDDFLSQEIEKVKMKHEGEMKVIIEQLENEKSERDIEINRLRHLLTSVKNGSTELDQLRKELETVHSMEMEKLRTYFERKCADLEKHYSEEVFSQKSQRMSGDTSASDISDQEIMHDENVRLSGRAAIRKKRSLEELFASPLHRQLTPTLDCFDKDCGATSEEIKIFYKDKIREISHKYDESTKRLRDKLRRFETKYADDEFMKSSPIERDRPNVALTGRCVGGIDESSAYLIIDQDDFGINESQEIRQIAAEYDRRLQEQVMLAKQDILHELENHIQALLSETTTDDNHWPPELILLREKFTAKSQLEIAQLQIKHEEEMSRLKLDYEKQLNRKNKRHSTFDLSRDLEQIVSERDNLRELSTTFRYLLQELAKCVSICEDDLNITLIEELHKHGILGGRENEHNVGEAGDNEQSSGLLNLSTQSNEQLRGKLSKSFRLVPDVSGLLSVIEDPVLIDFIADSNKEGEFKLKECLDKLKSEANGLLVLSEKLHSCREKHDDGRQTEKRDSCEEEDGLKAIPNRTTKLDRANSFNERILQESDSNPPELLLSLPADINRLEICSEQAGKEEIYSANISSSDLSQNDLENKLIKSESARVKLSKELQLTIARNKELGAELHSLRDQIKQLDSSQREDLSEGYGLSDLQSPPRNRKERNASASFSQLQDRARNLLSTPTKKMADNTAQLLHLIEEFCREGDKVFEDSKRDRDDLQAQIDAADKKLKDTRQFLDIQAADREAERDEFMKEIEKLKTQIREKEKERCSFEMASKEFEQMDQQIRDLTQQVSEYEAQKEKLETELKASIDKIFVLREIITDLEMQVDTKALNESVLNEKVKELEAFIASQASSNETLQHEVESLKAEIGHGYQERISQLEEQLRNTRTNSEQNIAIDQLAEQLRDIETTLDQKTKTLESLHAAVNANSLSENYSEEISAQNLPKDIHPPTPQASPINTPRYHSLPVDEIQRVFQKLSKHTRVEEAAIKRIKDLEMQVSTIRSSYLELENERKLLQEKMTEQLVRISSLQTKLDEQRRRAEELNRQGTSDFAARIHDLQSEVYNLKETLSSRDKQITNLKNHLEQSKTIIDRQEAELAITIQGDSGRVDTLEAELKSKSEEIKQLKEKMKKEMINKLALPDLMETMLADKNEEIDHLKEQLERKDKELQEILNINLGANETSSKEKEKTSEHGDGSKGSGRTLSDIVSISEYDEPDVIRRAVTAVDTPLELPQSNFPEKTMESSKCATGNLTEKRSGDLSLFDIAGASNAMRTFDQPNFFMGASTSSKGGNNTTPSFIPRQINFSEFADETKIKESTPQIVEITGEDPEEVENLRQLLKSTELKAESLKISLEAVESEKTSEITRLKTELEAKTKIHDELVNEKEKLQEKLSNFVNLEEELQTKTASLEAFKKLFSDLELKIIELEKLLDEKTVEMAKVTASLAQKTDTAADSNEKILELNHEIETLSVQIKQKDEKLTKYEKNAQNAQQNENTLRNRLSEIEEQKDAIQVELDLTRAELSEKSLQYQKVLLDLESYTANYEKLQQELLSRDKQLNDAQSRLTQASNINELRQKIEELSQRNAFLETELERLRSQSGESKPYSLDEIAEKVEKELNYSAQLDSNILKAIESEDEANLVVKPQVDPNRAPESNLTSQLDALKLQLEKECKHSAQLQQQLNDVRTQTQSIQQQDADIIEAMRVRLEAAIEKETELHKILDDEREKCERLSNQLSVMQRTEARKANSSLKTPPESPRKARATDEAEAIERLKQEIKLLNSQNERERERVNDLQRVLEREKVSFEKELADRVEYAEKLKRELDKLKHEKDSADEEVEHLQERLTSATREIESLEGRVSTLQEAETRRAYRRGKERAETTQSALEIQELRSKIVQLENERDHLNEVIKLLREDVERGAQREAKLAGALANSGTDNSMPEQFMQKLKEMNYLLAENAKENRQMAETLQYLTDERKMLQRKCEELETNCQTGALAANTLSDMEERANHLFGKYLRVESHRKALVHQKRYLMIILQTYQENEAKALNLLNGGEPRRKKKRSFKSVALIIIAIERMKFIVRRWHTGRIVVSKSIFNIATQKRVQPSLASGSAATATRTGKHILTSLSPPCRDRPQLDRHGFVNIATKAPLQAPPLISECSDKLDWTNRWKPS